MDWTSANGLEISQWTGHQHWTGHQPKNWTSANGLDISQWTSANGLDISLASCANYARNPIIAYTILRDGVERLKRTDKMSRNKIDGNVQGHTGSRT